MTQSFNPLHGNMLRSVADDIQIGYCIFQAEDLSPWTIACMSGHISYVATAHGSKSAGALISNCQRVIFARLGLLGSDLTAEQENIKGFLVGLFDGMVTSLDPDAAMDDELAGGADE